MEEKKTFFMKLNRRPFEAIKRGTKRIEIRANEKKPSGNSVNLMRAGDNIIFEKEGSDEKIECTIEQVVLYPNVRELLLKEGTSQTLSSTDDIEGGIKSVESLSNYKELISKNGVFAIKLSNVKII